EKRTQGFVKFTDTIHARLRPSWLLRIVSCLIHLLALLILSGLALYRPGFWLLVAGIAVSGWREDWHLRLCSPGDPVGFRWSFDHRLELIMPDGSSVKGKCIDARCWGTLWVRLRIREPGKFSARTLIVPVDAVESDI